MDELEAVTAESLRLQGESVKWMRNNPNLMASLMAMLRNKDRAGFIIAIAGSDQLFSAVYAHCCLGVAWSAAKILEEEISKNR